MSISEYQQHSAEIYGALASGKNQQDKLKGLDQEDRSIVLIALNNMRFVDKSDSVKKIHSNDKDRVVKQLNKPLSHKNSSGLLQRLIKFIQNIFGRISSATLRTAYHDVEVAVGAIPNLLKNKVIEFCETEKSQCKDFTVFVLNEIIGKKGIANEDYSDLIKTSGERRTTEIKKERLIAELVGLKAVYSAVNPPCMDSAKRLDKIRNQLSATQKYLNDLEEREKYFKYAVYILERISSADRSKTIEGNLRALLGAENGHSIKEWTDAYKKANNATVPEEYCPQISKLLFGLRPAEKWLVRTFEKEKTDCKGILNSTIQQLTETKKIVFQLKLLELFI